jgi:uncharacterized protein YfiM (DUF2279 family)
MRPRFALALVVCCGAAARAQTDPWWGPDKALHLGVSAGLSLGAGWILHRLGAPAPVDLAAGSGLALLLGAAKEGADRLGLGTPSWRDFTWDAVGCACGFLVGLALEALERWLSPARRLLLAPSG